MTEEKEKIFRIKLKPRDLDIIIHALGPYLKLNFDQIIKNWNHNKLLIFLNRLVNTSRGVRGRPDEWGTTFWQGPTKREFERRIDRMLTKVKDPFSTSKGDLS